MAFKGKRKKILFNDRITKLLFKQKTKPNKMSIRKFVVIDIKMLMSAIFFAILFLLGSIMAFSYLPDEKTVINARQAVYIPNNPNSFGDSILEKNGIELNINT